MNKKIVGIIAEFNPFTKGHEALISYAKNELKADAVVIAMSGSFTQRGEIACLDKYKRADIAIKAGCDLIFELPTIYATAAACDFALGGVALLNKTGIVTDLLFGSESGDIDKLLSVSSSISELSDSEAFHNALNDFLSQGLSFASARAKALASLGMDELNRESSNDILAIEYLNALRILNSDITPHTIKRMGASYNDNTLSNAFPSASAVRNAISAGTYKTGLLPFDCEDVLLNSTFVSSAALDDLLHLKLLETFDFSMYADCSTDLSNKIIKSKDLYTSREGFIELLKSKDLTYARISRVLAHILLGITKEDVCLAKSDELIPYLRLLACSDNGLGLLSAVKKSGTKLITSPKELPENRLLALDTFAADLHRICVTGLTKAAHKTEYTMPFKR